MAGSSRPMKQVTKKISRPNPLFEQWLTEWSDDAKIRGFTDTSRCYSEALKILKKYPILLHSGKECGIMKKFGPKICAKIDQKMISYEKNHPGAFDSTTPAVMLNSAVPKKRKAPSSTVTSRTNNNSAAAADPPPPPAEKKKRAPRKNKAAQNASPTAPHTSTSHTNGTPAVPDIEEDSDPDPCCIPAGEAQIKLLVDSGETSSGSLKKAAKKMAMNELNTQNIPYEIRKLNLGDFMWIAVYQDHELVLPYIVERKRVDDLSHSIKDKRYHEQKMRLKATGFKVVYLIEVVQCRTCLPDETLRQAEINTEIHNEFVIHRTSSVKETVSYLKSVTAVVTKKFKSKVLKNCMADDEPIYSTSKPFLCLYTFKEFNSGSGKVEDFTVRDMFALQLVQVSGLSAEAVAAFVEEFKTPALLRKALGTCAGDSECLELLASIKFGPLKRSVPEEVARKIWRFFMTADFAKLPNN